MTMLRMPKKQKRRPMLKIWADIGKRADRNAKAFPDERACLESMMDVYTRLKALGWNDIEYCPKDGTTFDAISMGSTGIHEHFYMGEWPDGSWWCYDGGETWPSRPTMFRLREAARAQGQG